MNRTVFFQKKGQFPPLLSIPIDIDGIRFLKVGFEYYISEVTPLQCYASFLPPTLAGTSHRKDLSLHY